MRLLAITSLLVISLNSCAKITRSETYYSAPVNWETKKFRIHFQAGPRGIDGKSYSFYQIIQKVSDGYGDNLVMESAHSIRGFGGDEYYHPKNWIRIIEDPHGTALLIEEDIPNDCAPCMNYLWVRMDDKFLKGSYFQLPPKSTGNGGGIDYEYPKVISLEGDLLKYRYSTGEVISKSIHTIEMADRPTPPG